MLLCPIMWEQRLLVFPHPEGGAIISPRDDFDKKIPMSFEGLLVGSKQLRDPRTVAEGYPTLLQASVRIKIYRKRAEEHFQLFAQQKTSKVCKNPQPLG
jgi:hypothetical protein